MKTDRLVSIIMILLEKKRVRAEQFADIFEVSKRTIYRDIESICMAGIPIRATSGVGGGFEIMPDYKVDKNVFTEKELSTLLMGLAGISGIIRGDEIIHTLSKVKSFIPPEQAERIRIRSSQIRVDADPWLSNTNIGKNLEAIRMAIDRSVLLAFDYIGQHSCLQNRTVEPYQLIIKNGSWYLYGFCQGRKDYRIFKLTRMIDVQLSDKKFEPKDFPNAQLSAEEHIRPLFTTVTLRIHESIAERVMDYCDWECFRRDGTEHYIVDFPFIDREYFYDMILGFGSRCVCLEPKEIKEKLLERIRVMEEIYM